MAGMPSTLALMSKNELAEPYCRFQFEDEQNTPTSGKDNCAQAGPRLQVDFLVTVGPKHKRLQTIVFCRQLRNESRFNEYPCLKVHSICPAVGRMRAEVLDPYLIDSSNVTSNVLEVETS